MDPAKIALALRCCTQPEDCPTHCPRYKNVYDGSCINQLMLDAAIAIEELLDRPDNHKLTADAQLLLKYRPDIINLLAARITSILDDLVLRETEGGGNGA